MGEKGEDGPGILFSAEMFVFLIEKQPMSTVFSARICVLGGGLRCVSFQLLVKQLFSARMLVRPKYIGIFCEDAGFCKNRMEIVRRCRRVVIGVGTRLRDYGPHDPR